MPCKVKLALSHHSLNEARDQVTSDKPLVFVMEQPKQDDDDDGAKRKKKKKKAKQTNSNMNSFGNGLSVNKFKGNSKFIIGFRCRSLDSSYFRLVHFRNCLSIDASPVQ